ncbi:MAG: winged helix-turn-helix domain-containing protein [Chloracidobacterium sp.]|nr:winged helix-turn-helix domain-containing protein [Chloracidobacterium sp.]
MSLKRKELYEFSRFRLDVPERLLLRDGKRVRLPDKAFQTLCVLVRRAGELVTKDELIGEVWADSIVEENNLDQKISVLRQTLGEQRAAKGKEKFIETVRGHGYRFLPEVRPVIGDRNGGNHDETVEPASAEESAVTRGADGADELSGEQENVVPRRPLKQRLWLAAFALVLAGVGAFAVWYFAFGRVRPAADIDSVAVMPFENSTRSADMEYLGDGIAESLINDLSRLSGLKVLSGRSAISDGETKDARSIGTALNVKAVLSGNIKTVGDQLIVNVRFDNAEDNHRIWGEQYTAKLADIFNVQNDITRRVSSSLHRRIAGQGDQTTAKQDTHNTDAYQLYLQGLYHWNKRTVADIHRSMELFQQAIDKDPAYAKAYAGLASAYNVLPVYDKHLKREDIKELIAKRNAATLKAQALDDGLPEVHALLAANYEDNLDLPAAEAEYRRAIELNPNIATVHSSYSLFLSWFGRHDEAMAEIEKARSLEPFSPSIAFNVGVRFADSRRFDEAIAQYKRVLETEPEHPLTHLFLAQAYDDTARFQEAIAEYKLANVLLEKESAESAAKRAAELTAALKHGGSPEYWKKRLEFSRRDLNDGNGTSYDVAVAYARLNRDTAALEFLDRSFAEREFDLLWCRNEPAFDALRQDRRFTDLLHRIGLPEQ